MSFKLKVDQNVIFYVSLSTGKKCTAEETFNKSGNHTRTVVYFGYCNPACLLFHIYSLLRQMLLCEIYTKYKRLVTAGNILSATAACSNTVGYFLQWDQFFFFYLSQRINTANYIFVTRELLMFSNYALKMGLDG